MGRIFKIILYGISLSKHKKQRKTVKNRIFLETEWAAVNSVKSPASRDVT